jgi:hypothetical protein
MRHLFACVCMCQIMRVGIDTVFSVNGKHVVSCAVIIAPALCVVCSIPGMTDYNLLVQAFLVSLSTFNQMNS